uniref:Transcription factor TFIIB cyclin-like domain-containing protein n=1 Tax=Chromera velia CCMP2878 TaxID=1169474 RepID=A0A0G4HJI8_9ALVE|mmetsp:Transcript_47953/g.94628  ORF Transcript_47953/g.94628 Transcript_47953/m.94628 type:complete len:353 (+) Transcript_47953:327-1385(+)|eukprot:Cvel_28182.t1-p1 / transcript=Cvel_28182.t1 / gene=Cvel_28182 / organism=Chromera_velia_CCMP2878 / gene_product=Transcription initiation factor IIB, putative / transcript_product=Transcription initiation factor IIB, putative / location=Cvel_scaffold3642:13244-14299(-) / protein_length=352 / sequence_SO=supercontig / SO=protein_coding / is_pseudo=false
MFSQRYGGTFRVLEFTPDGDTICPMCKDTSCVVKDNKSGDEICRRTGRVLQERCISEEQEWRTFGNDANATGESKNRVGGANDVWLDDGGMERTQIATSNQRMARLNDTATQASQTDRILLEAFRTFRNVANHQKVRESVVERGKDMIKHLSDKDQLQRRKTEVHMLAVLYLACKEDGSFIQLRELRVGYPEITEEQLKNAIKILQKKLEGRPTVAQNQAAVLCNRVCSKLCIRDPHKSLIADACTAAEMQIASAVRPSSLVGAVLWLAVRMLGLTHRIKDIKDAAGAAVQTIQQACKKLEIRKIFSDEFIRLCKPEAVLELEGASEAGAIADGEGGSSASSSSSSSAVAPA